MEIAASDERLATTKKYMVACAQTVLGPNSQPLTQLWDSPNYTVLAADRAGRRTPSRTMPQNGWRDHNTAIQPTSIGLPCHRTCCVGRRTSPKTLVMHAVP
eukprot:9616039-Lingulodinium_polyedra.AAC.1